MSDSQFKTVYVISVAAELAGMHPQTLRQYDRLGLVTPRRTAGRGRRYTPQDVEDLREVQRLSQEEGINLAGIKRIMAMHKRIKRLEEENRALRELAERLEQRHFRIFNAGPSGEVALRTGKNHSRYSQSQAIVRYTPAKQIVLWGQPR